MTILVFIVLHLSHIKKYYSQTLVELTVSELRSRKELMQSDETTTNTTTTASTTISMGSDNSSLDNINNNICNSNNSQNSKNSKNSKNNLEIGSTSSSLSFNSDANLINFGSLNLLGNNSFSSYRPNISITVENFDENLDKKKRKVRYAYKNPNFENGSDLSQSIELSELSFSTKSSNSTK